MPPCASGSAPNDLDGVGAAGHPHPSPRRGDDTAFSLKGVIPDHMLHSALINVMVKAARRAGRSLSRDLGEIENLQVSLKGPANFVSLADKRAEEMIYTDLAKARPGYRRMREGGGHGEGPV